MSTPTQDWPEVVERLEKLERKIGQQTLEIDFLKRALQPVEERRRQPFLQHR